MTKKLLALVLAICLTICAGGALADTRTEGVTMTVEEYEPMHELTAQYAFRFGVAFSHFQLKDIQYRAFVTRHVDSLTPTNELKAYSLLSQSLSRKTADGMPAMDFKNADDMVRFAQTNGLKVRGHVLVWDAYMTDWFFHEEYLSSKPYASREVMLERLRSYIFQVVGHFEEKFPGVVYCWDVVNEAVGDGGDFLASDPRHVRKTRAGTDNLFYKCIGPDYVEISFLYAREAAQAAGADIALFYNDYNAFNTDKSRAIRTLIESINSYSQDENGENIKLCDGVGMQGYIGGYGTQSGCMNNGDLTRIKAAISAYADMGLQVQMTEVAVRNYQGDDTSVARHAEFYGQLAKLLRSINRNDERKPFTGLCVWGLLDAPTLAKGNYNYMLNSPYCGLLTERYEIKTAFDTVHRVLKGE